MTTIKVFVKNSQDASLLMKLLRAMKFVQHVEQIDKESNVSNQFEKLQAFLASNTGSGLFKEIEDPLEWQKNLRNEWE